MLESGESYRELVHRTLTVEQAKRFAIRLRKLESEFKADTYEKDGTDGRESTHALLMILGPRKLRRLLP